MTASGSSCSFHLGEETLCSVSLSARADSGLGSVKLHIVSSAHLTSHHVLMLPSAFMPWGLQEFCNRPSALLLHLWSHLLIRCVAISSLHNLSHII